MALQFSFDVDQLTQWNFPVKLRGRILPTRNPFYSDEVHRIFSDDAKIDPANFDLGEDDPEFQDAVRAEAHDVIDWIFTGSDAWADLRQSMEDKIESSPSTHECAAIAGAYLGIWRMRCGDPDWRKHLDYFSFVKNPRAAQIGNPKRSPSGETDLPPGRHVGGSPSSA